MRTCWKLRAYSPPETAPDLDRVILTWYGRPCRRAPQHGVCEYTYKNAACRNQGGLSMGTLSGERSSLHASSLTAATGANRSNPNPKYMISLY